MDTTAEDLELLRPFTSSPGSDLSRSHSSSSSMVGDDAPGAADPVSAGPFNFQTQVLSTSPVKSVRYLTPMPPSSSPSLP